MRLHVPKPKPNQPSRSPDRATRSAWEMLVPPDENNGAVRRIEVGASGWLYQVQSGWLYQVQNYAVNNMERDPGSIGWHPPVFVPR